MANYFDTGKMPSEELICEDTEGPWDKEALEHISPQIQAQWVM